MPHWGRWTTILAHFSYSPQGHQFTEVRMVPKVSPDPEKHVPALSSLHIDSMEKDRMTHKHSHYSNCPALWKMRLVNRFPYVNTSLSFKPDLLNPCRFLWERCGKEQPLLLPASSSSRSVKALRLKGMWHLTGVFWPADMIRCALASGCLARWPRLSQSATVWLWIPSRPVTLRSRTQSFQFVFPALTMPHQRLQRGKILSADGKPERCWFQNAQRNTKTAIE